MYSIYTSHRKFIIVFACYTYSHIVILVAALYLVSL